MIKKKLSTKLQSGVLLLCILCITILAGCASKNSPANFIEPYDKNKVEKANEICMQLSKLEMWDKHSIISIVTKAESSLGIETINSEMIEELKYIFNIRNFMDPYDADKISYANKVFGILASGKITIKDYLAICNQAMFWGHTILFHIPSNKNTLK